MDPSLIDIARKNILKYNSLIGLEEPANFFCVRDRTVSMLGYWPEFFNRLRDFSLNTFTGDLTVDSLGYHYSIVVVGNWRGDL